MQISNPLQMNDWEIKKFFTFVLSLQLALWGIIGLDAIGIYIPIMRPLIGFLYLTFIPGVIILRILRLHKIGIIETIVYAVGLSVALIMVIGASINTAYPVFGIIGPISILPLIITISAVTLILCILCYIRDKDFCDPSFISIKNVLSPPVLFSCLIPFVAVFGTYMVNFYDIHIAIILLIFFISIIVILTVFDLFVPSKIYPLVIIMIAISLLYQNSLLSMYIWGWDSQAELYLANLVKMNSIWDSSINYSINGMLSIVMLAPIYSIFSDMSLTWVFKIFYPILFSFVPFGLYRVFQRQSNNKIAFLSCIFFMSINTFYYELIMLSRQQIGELYLVLLLLLLIDKNMNKMNRSFLSIIFSLSLAVSHYGLSYIYMFIMLALWSILIIADSSLMQKNLKYLSPFIERKKPNNLIIEDRAISMSFIILFIVFTLTWYIHVSASSSFETIASIGKNIAKSLTTDFLNPDAAQGLKLVTAKSAPGIIHTINKFIIYLNQFFILIGAVVIFKKDIRAKLGHENLALVLISIGLCFAGLAVPFFASSINMSRLYQITTIYLAPICLIGGLSFLNMIIKIVRKSSKNQNKLISVRMLSIYFTAFFLYQSGVVWEVTEFSPNLISFNSTFDFPRFNDREVASAEWLTDKRDNELIFADGYRRLLLSSFDLFNLTTSYEKAPLIYLGTFNIMDKKIKLHSFEDVTLKYFDVPLISIIKNRYLVYSNGGSFVYYR